jgi:hypothetical protein
MEKEMVLPVNKKARVAGLLYIIVILLASYGAGYVPSKIMVGMDATGTSGNILADELLFRTGIFTHLVSVITIAIMVLLLYQIFGPVDKTLTKMMALPVFIQVPIFVVLEVFHLAAIMILGGESLSSFNASQRQELAFFFMRLHGSGIGISQVFWGLWLLPFGLLVLKSGFIPRFLAILLFINGIGYVVDGSAFIFLKRADFLIIREFVKYTFIIGVAPTMLWLLIKGVRSPASSAYDKKAIAFIDELK